MVVVVVVGRRNSSDQKENGRKLITLPHTAFNKKKGKFLAYHANRLSLLTSQYVDRVGQIVPSTAAAVVVVVTKFQSHPENI